MSSGGGGGSEVREVMSGELGKYWGGEVHCGISKGELSEKKALGRRFLDCEIKEG